MPQRKTKVGHIKKQKFNNEHCDSDMTFEDCEMAILRHAVEETETISSPDIPIKTDEEAVTDKAAITEEETIEKKIDSLPLQPNINLEGSDSSSTIAAAAGGAFFKSPKINMPKIGGKIAEDIRMTARVFNKCIIAR
jgi:hypothetical protein